MKNIIIRARAPLRVSFAGGGTDIREYYEKYGGAVMSSTIAKYAYTTLKPLQTTEFRVLEEEFNIDYAGDITNKLKDSESARFFNAIVNHFSPKTGFRLILHSDVAYGSGLGSSSTAMVSLVGAFNSWLNLNLSPYEIAETAYKIEREDLGILGGKQDQYAATFGGFNFIEFKKDKVVVNQMKLKRSIIYDLQFRLLLVNTGTTRFSGSVITSQIKKLSEEETLQHYEELKKLTIEIKDKLFRDELDDIGPLLNEEWAHKKMLSPGITTKSVDKLFDLANKNGSLGGKLLGAGGGGYALLITNEENRFSLVDTLKKSGYETNYIEFVPTGLEVWTRNGING